MSESAEAQAAQAAGQDQAAGAEAENIKLPAVSYPSVRAHPDMATILGLILSILLVVGAIFMGGDGGNGRGAAEALLSFVNGPSILIVLLGTLTATAISYTVDELAKAWDVVGQAIIGKSVDPSKLSLSLLDTAVVAKKKGILALSGYDKEFQKDPFIKKAFQMTIDGFKPEDIEFFLMQEIAKETQRHKRSASITRRASEVAPAMGLIGTLVGLVLMLGNLENPESIGPSMAVALLTTFYGAILGTVIMAPLSVKLEKRASDQALIKTLVQTACVSIARQDNPRKLEMLLNADLPPAQRIRYFD